MIALNLLYFGPGLTSTSVQGLDLRLVCLTLRQAASGINLVEKGNLITLIESLLINFIRIYILLLLDREARQLGKMRFGIDLNTILLVLVEWQTRHTITALHASFECLLKHAYMV
jgi:hypothetical protein